MLLKYSGHYLLACDVDRCADPGVKLATTDITVARRMAFDLGWQERVRKGGATKSHYACPKCVARLKATPASSRHSTGTHGDFMKKH